MKRVNLTQGSADWLQWRQGGIGASDAATIMGLSPFETPFGLWMLKTGRSKPKKTTRAMQHGHDNEEFARDMYIEITGEFVTPACFINEDFGFPMLASLDGYPLVEIKCPQNPLDHFKAAREGIVPQHYMIQMQHQMAVCGAGNGAYASFYEGGMVILPVQRDESLIARICVAEREFWGWVQADEYPIPQGEEDRTGDERLEMLMRRVAESDEMIRGAEERKRESLAELARELKAAKTVAGSFIANYSYRRGYTEKQPRTVQDNLSLTVKERRAA